MIYTIDDLALSAARADAVYEMSDDEARNLFQSLGSRVLGRLSEDDCQVVVSQCSDGVVEATVAGTRFQEGTLVDRLSDLLQDGHFEPVQVPIGGAVAAGALQRMTRAAEFARSVVGGELPVRWCGHSLGGQGASIVAGVSPPELIHSIVAWEPPKGATAEFWRAIPDVLSRTTIVFRDGDPFVSWPPDPRLHHPDVQIVYLTSSPPSITILESPAQWPGPGIFDESSHNSTTLVTLLRGLSESNP